MRLTIEGPGHERFRPGRKDPAASPVRAAHQRSQQGYRALPALWTHP